MIKHKYIAPATKLHSIIASTFLSSSSLQLDSTTGNHSKKNASTDAASRLGSSIWDEEEADEEFDY
jgi:hypothetical protein